MITFAYEKLKDVLDEPGVLDLVLGHYYEISEDQKELPLNVDWPRFLAAEKANHLLLYTARDGNQLIGYQTFFIEPDITTKSTGAWDVPFYLDPEYRRTGNGLRSTGNRLMFDPEAELKKRGAKRIVRHAKVRQREAYETIMRRNGYRPFEIRYTKIL